jgi:hypothetical protein
MSEVDETRAARSYWIEVILLAVVASVSYLVLPLIGPLFCLVPLQALLVRRGITAFGYAAALFGIAAVSFRLLTGWGELPEQIAGGLMRAEVLVLILAVGGLYVLASPRFTRYRILYRLLGATVAAGVATAPLMAGFLETASQAAESFLMTWARSASTSLGDELATDAVTAARNMAESFREATPGLLRSYLLIYCVFLTSQWWIGTAVGARSARMPSPLRRVTEFHAPDHLVWVLVGGLAVVALDQTGALERAGLELLAAIGWNAVLVMAFVFGIQGVAIMRVFAGRYGQSGRTISLLIGVMLIIGLFALPWLLLIISAFGASEIWVHYRQRLQAGGSERDDDADRP